MSKFRITVDRVTKCHETWIVDAADSDEALDLLQDGTDNGELESAEDDDEEKYDWPNASVEEA